MNMEKFGDRIDENIKTEQEQPLSNIEKIKALEVAKGIRSITSAVESLETIDNEDDYKAAIGQIESEVKDLKSSIEDVDLRKISQGVGEFVAAAVLLTTFFATGGTPAITGMLTGTGIYLYGRGKEAHKELQDEQIAYEQQRENLISLGRKLTKEYLIAGGAEEGEDGVLLVTEAQIEEAQQEMQNDLNNQAVS